MIIKQVNINDLIHADYNPRTLTEKQAEDLKESIVKFGFVDPIIVNENIDRKNIIVGGHQRVNVALGMGIKKVPVFYVDLDINAERELNVRLNKNTGEWDWDALANMFEIEELVDWGFAEAELLGNDAGSQPDELPDVDLDGEVEGNVEWVVIRFQKKPDYENICKLLGMREGARTIDFEEVRSYFPVEEDV